MIRNTILILLCCLTSCFAQDKFKVSNTANVRYTNLDIVNLIKFTESSGFVEIDSIEIGIQFLPGPFDTNYVTIYEKPIVSGHNKVRRNLFLAVNYWNNNDSSKIYCPQQFKMISLDTLSTWIVNTNIGTLNFLQDASVNYNEVNNIVQLICTKAYTFSLTQYIEGKDTAVSVSVHFTDPNSLYNDLKHLTKIKRMKNNYFLNYNFYGSGEEVKCVLEGDSLIVKDFSFWIN